METTENAVEKTEINDYVSEKFLKKLEKRYKASVGILIETNKDTDTDQMPQGGRIVYLYNTKKFKLNDTVREPKQRRIQRRIKLPSVGVLVFAHPRFVHKDQSESEMPICPMIVYRGTPQERLSFEPCSLHQYVAVNLPIRLRHFDSQTLMYMDYLHQLRKRKGRKYALNVGAKYFGISKETLASYLGTFSSTLSTLKNEWLIWKKMRINKMTEKERSKLLDEITMGQILDMKFENRIVPRFIKVARESLEKAEPKKEVPVAF